MIEWVFVGYQIIRVPNHRMDKTIARARAYIVNADNCSLSIINIINDHTWCQPTEWTNNGNMNAVKEET